MTSRWCVWRYRSSRLYPLSYIESEPERIQKIADIKMSVDKVSDLAQTGMTMQILFPQKQKSHEHYPAHDS